MLHQTVIGLEAQEQMEMAGFAPDIVIGCAGGGSNFAGLAFPYIGDKIKGKNKARIHSGRAGVLPDADARALRLRFRRHGHLTPMVKMHTLGSTFMPPPIHAGGLRYHGMSPMVSHVKELGLIEARAYAQLECFAAAVQFARCEGIVPAPESSHAIKAAVDEALRCKREGKAETILFNLSGHGHFDMGAYIAYFQRRKRVNAQGVGQLSIQLRRVHAAGQEKPSFDNSLLFIKHRNDRNQQALASPSAKGEAPLIEPDLA